MTYVPAQLRVMPVPPRGGGAGLGDASCVARELAVYKRVSVRGPLVPATTTSAHLCGGRRSLPGVLTEMTDVGGAP
jgi:hypothetical protein